MIFVDAKNCFNVCQITDNIFSLINGKSFKQNENIKISDLRLVKCLHLGFDDSTKQGELIVNKLIAEEVSEIMQKLYEAKFPIEKIELVDKYNANDEISMADNNSYSFCYRQISSSDKLSLHALGLAIDINPVQNPYVKEVSGKLVVLPEKGESFLDRTQAAKGIITEESDCVKIFASYGFAWGGDFVSLKDYHHFEKHF